MSAVLPLIIYEKGYRAMRIRLVKNENTVSTVFLQTRLWADFKSQTGWTYSRYDVWLLDSEDSESSSGPFALTVMERGLGLGQSLAYIPHGPALMVEPQDRGALLLALAESLSDKVAASCMFIRFDPLWYVAEDPQASLVGEPVAQAVREIFRRPLKKGSDVQPPDSVVLDLSLSDDELLAGMKPKWRYNIKLAGKKGVSVASEGTAALDEFYALYEATAARDKIAIHPRSYYERLLGQTSRNSAEPSADIRLWIARHGGKALAAIITIYYGDEAIYLYGASGDEGRNLMPAYALQWAAIRAAREAGCVCYDFYGIPPVEDPSHAMAGLYRFKTGFGGQIRHYPGAWDYARKPVVYAAFRMAEQARLFWHKTVMKRLRR